jgi:iron complex outermembrane receptor protein
MNNTKALRALMLATTALCAGWTGAAFAQSAPASQDATVEEIVVVGSRIEGAKATAALPVTVVDSKQLAAIGATSGDDLFRSIPQMGDVNYNSSYLPGSSNSARGDIGSVNLRNLGSGNTLVLLNGRRVVAHPTSQADGTSLVPTLTYNTNAIPTSGLKRLEVLRDGAAAIYGTDAVAGVVNTVLQDNYNGGDVEAQYGYAAGHPPEGIRPHRPVRKNLRSRQCHGVPVLRPAHGAANDGPGLHGLGRQAPAVRRHGLRRRHRAGRPRHHHAVGQLHRVGGRSPERTLITSTAGAFHIQPTTNAGSLASLGNGISIDDAAIATSGDDRNLRYDAAATGLSVMPELKRINVFLTGNYRVTEEITAFGELGVYRATTHAWQAPSATTSAQVITVPRSNYWNPFGPTAFADGTTNPNRLAGTTAPAAGLNVTINGYQLADAGLSKVDVENTQTRYLGGLKGEKFGFKWESALLYSAAEVKDVSDGISATALQKQLALSTPDAYNPFNGANLSNPSVGDSAASSGGAQRHSSQVDARQQEHAGLLGLPDFEGRLVHLAGRRPGPGGRRRIPARDPEGRSRRSRRRHDHLHQQRHGRGLWQRPDRHQPFAGHQGVAQGRIGLCRTGRARHLARDEHSAGAQRRGPTGRARRELQRRRFGGQAEGGRGLGSG